MPQRATSTSFKKGQPSANPGGRPKGAVADIAALAREHGPLALQTLVECLSDPRHKVAAAQALLDRGYGRPQQTTRVEGDVNVLHLIAAQLVSRELDGVATVEAAPVVAQLTNETPDE